MYQLHVQGSIVAQKDLKHFWLESHKCQW